MHDPDPAAPTEGCLQVDDLKPAFPEIPAEAWPCLSTWAVLMREWNARLNLISRKDIQLLESRHLAPCLAITRKLKLMHGASVLDLGTGGGLPGLPLAICYPHARFTLLDSIAKKTRAVADMADTLGLRNVRVECRRAESFNQRFDFVMGRAVTRLDGFLALARHLLLPGRKHSLANGVLYWKGGDYAVELEAAGIQHAQCFCLSEIFPDPLLEGKMILHISEREISRG